jgi:hypothetical protein
VRTDQLQVSAVDIRALKQQYAGIRSVLRWVDNACVLRCSPDEEDEAITRAFWDAMEAEKRENAEQLLIARVHVAVHVLQVRGQQYKYRGHVVQFFKNVGKVYMTLPLLPSNLEIVLLRPPRSALNSNHDAQFRKRFMVRRQYILA